MQIVGALFAVVLIKYLHPGTDGEDIVVPHEPTEQIA